MAQDGAATHLARATSWQADDALNLVRAVYSQLVSQVEWVGSGHWSDCFSFQSDDVELVIRIGHLLEDFHKDQLAAQFGIDSLPVPQILAVGQGGEHRGTAAPCFYAISQRVRGTPIEQVHDWDSVIPALVDLLESLRQVSVAGFDGWGRWDGTGHAEADSWRRFLLAVDQDPPSSRVHGWKQAMSQSTELTAKFARGYDQLRDLATVETPRSLVHNDLFNRNVHMIGPNVSGVFDWGNSLIGDHLYDLGVLCFWEPWWPHVQVQPVLDALRVRWIEPGHQVENFADRFRTCLLHIGLEHISYHCFLDNLSEANRVADRMEVVAQTNW